MAELAITINTAQTFFFFFFFFTYGSKLSVLYNYLRNVLNQITTVNFILCFYVRLWFERVSCRKPILVTKESFFD